MKQMIDGREVDLTPAELQEVAAREAEWAATAAEREKAQNAQAVREKAVDALILERAGKPAAPKEVVDWAAAQKE